MAANQAEVDLIVSAAGALPDLERQLSQIIRQTENDADAIEVDVAIQAREAARTLGVQLDTAVNAAEGSVDGIEVGVLIDQRDALRTLDRQLSQIVEITNRGGVVDDPVLVQAVLDGPQSLRSISGELRQVVAAIQATDPEIEIDAELDRDVERNTVRLTSALETLGRAGRTSARGVGVLTGGVAALSLGAGSLVSTLASVTAAVQQIAPAAAVVTSALLTQQLAAGTLKLAMIGVEDAIESAFDPDVTPAELEKSLQRLAPEARKFVTALRGMRSELREVQQGVQNRVFRDLDSVLGDLADKLGPTLTRSLNRAGDSLNAMGRSAASAALKLQENGVLGQALDGANSALERLEQTPGRVATSFGLLAAASSPALNRIATAVDELALKAQEKLQAAFDSGALEESINKAVDTISQFGRTLGNFASGFGNVFSGLTDSGRGLFDILESLSESFERLTASSEFQSILNELALTADVLIANLTPLVEEIFKQLGPVIEELAPVVRDFVSAIGPELIPILQELGPILLDIALIIKEQLPLAIDLANAAIDALGVALVLVGGALDLARQAAEKFSEFYNSDFVSSFRTASNAAVTHRGVITDAILRWTSEGLASIRNFQSGLGDFSANLRTTFVDGFRSAFNTVIENVRGFLNIVSQSFSALPGQLYTVGVQIMNGLGSGLLAGVSRVIGIARDIASSVTSTIREALDIRSPSKVMAQLGKFTVEGFVKGMDAQLANVRDSAKKLAAIPAGVLGPRGGSLEVAQARLPSLPTVRGQGTSVIQVYIGNQLVEQFINDRMKAFNTGQVRIKTQGVRL